MTWKPIPRGPVGRFERRHTSPGLFEFTSGTRDKACHTYPQALLSGSDCRHALDSKEHYSVIKTKEQRITLHANSLAAYATGAEDRWAVDKVFIRPHEQYEKEGTWWSKWKSEGEGEEAVFMSIIDGHGRHHVADIVETALHACIAWAMAKDPAAIRGDDDTVMRGMRDAYRSISQDISQAVMRAVRHPEYSDTTLIGMPSVSQLIIAQYEKTGGECASTALLYKGRLYAAGLGDSRIIAVWKKEEWLMRVMVQDHNGFNPGEVARIQEEHPDDEKVMKSKCDGAFYRLKDGLLPTRCIGDTLYNRTPDEREQIKAQLQVDVDAPKSKMTDPPYLEWTPQVVVHDAADLRFLILATDGEAAMGTVAHAEAPLRADVPWLALEPSVNMLSDVFPSAEMPGYDEGAWIFEDENPATFLLKNALCGGDRDLLRQMLSLRYGTRVFRDDMTAL